MERIFCIKHEESTPSLVVYPTHAYCYGGCGRIELSELGKESSGAPKERYRENLQEARKYIDGLPKKEIRGFLLPYDDYGYYLVWTDADYYKRRNWDDSGAKYKNPSGHSQPPYWVRREHYPTLCISEGEFNAMSVAEAFPEWDVVSPGSASDFKTGKTRHFLLTYCIRYSIVVVMVDRDGPGTEAAIHTKGLLVEKVPQVRIALMSKDANEWCCEKGKEALRAEVEAELQKGL